MKTINIISRIGIILLLSILIGKNSNGQIPSTKEEIDSLVKIMKHDFLLADEDSLIAFYLRTRDTSQVFQKEEKMSIIIELKSRDDSIFAKVFYACNKNLIFMDEKHYILNERNIVNTVQKGYFKIFYHAYYYVLNDFFAGGDMSYGYGFKDYSYSPEPINYTNKMIKQCREYLKSD